MTVGTVILPSRSNIEAAVEFVHLLELGGRKDDSTRMAAACFNVMQSMPRMGIAVIGIIDAELHAILGDRGAAIQALRSAVNAGWAYYWLRPFESNHNFESLSDDPEFTRLSMQYRSGLWASSRRFGKWNVTDNSHVISMSSRVSSSIWPCRSEESNN